MGLTDVILFPIYVLIFHLIFSARRKRIHDPLLKKYHKHGFWIKVFSCIAFTIFNVYISLGDSIVLYYREGINFTHLIFKDPSNVKWLFMAGKDFDQNLLADTFNTGYFASESNYFIAKLVCFLSFFSFGSYMVINLFFSMISFAGVWRLFKFFYELYPHLHKKIAIAIIYLPTFIFWSSGILKDPLCTGMLGWLTYAAYKLFIKREKLLKNSIVFCGSAYVLGLVKSYIIASYLPFLILFIILYQFKKIKETSTKIGLVLLIFIFGVVGFAITASKLQEELGILAIDKLTESVKTTQTNFISMADLAESSFSLGVEFDGSTTSLIKMAPAAITATLFRPYLWESKKIATLLSSLESLALMLFTLYVLIRAGLFTFLGGIFKDPVIIYCFWFSILFALFVGATTLNFGTLVRYKIPCMPFYIIALSLILERKKSIKLKKEAEKKSIEKPMLLT